jgi:hypothetical protein
MIFELRVYTMRPGTVNQALEASGTVAREIREGDKYGKLEGHWASEIGTLNQYVHLWSYEDLPTMLRLRKELSEKPEWKKKYVPLILPHLIRQEVSLLEPVLDMKQPIGENNFHELRTYQLRPGTAKNWAAQMAEAMPVREKYSKNIGLWVNVTPDPNKVTHLWSYATWEERMQARRDSQNDPEWKDFLSYARPLMGSMESIILSPSRWSPRK